MTKNPYKHMTNEELVLMKAGLLKSVMRGYEDPRKEKVSSQDSQVLSDIIHTLTEELKKRG